MKPRSFKEALNTKSMLGFFSMYSSPGIIERIGKDWDWCWIDCQHGEWGPHNAVQAVRACDFTGIFSLVRTPGHDPGVIGKILDTACHAVLVPMVNSREQAEAVVAAAKFAPIGGRSYGGRRPFDVYGGAYANPDQPQPLLGCQIETLAALEQVDAIAATNGVDVLFFGPDDLALSKGIRMGEPRAEDCFDAEMAAVVEATKRHGKIAGCVVGTPTALKHALELGYQLVNCTADARLLANFSKSHARDCYTVLDDDAPRGAADQG
jgi:4-hydroxy-2-oxoheptanedioate aldolase